MTAAAPIRSPLFLTLLAVLSRQAAAHSIQNTPMRSSPTYDDLSTSLAVNQLAILQLMHDSLNASCATVEIRRESDADREEAKKLEEALGAHVDRVLQALEARQRQHMQQMLGALNSTVVDILTIAESFRAGVEERREEITGEVVKVVPEAQMPASQATEQPTEEEAAAVPEVAYLGAIVHNDTLPSMCGGNKFLNGTIGSLEVVKSGTYSSGVLCSWNLNFPKGSSVSLTWDYIDMENQSSCSYDWVEVLDVTHSQLVYGRKLCGSLNSSILKLLNVRLHGTHNLLVSFRSDGSNEGRGFRMLYHPD